MRLHSREPRKRQLNPVEVLGRTTEVESDAWFDPKRDFDPEIKRSMLEDLSRSDSGYTFEMDGMEYFVALFPDEFADLAGNDSSTEFTLRSKASGHLLQDPNRPKNLIEPFEFALKYLLLFPGTAELIDIPQTSKKALERRLQSGPTLNGYFVEALFFQRLVLGELGDHESEWKKVVEEIKLMKQLLPPFSTYLKYVAKIRLLFPEKDISQLFTTSDQKLALNQLRELRKHRQKKWNGFEEDNRTQYAEEAWWVTILAAKKVGISSGGKIFFEIPSSGLRKGPELPVRPTV